jgi:hypothetical protein
MQYFSDHLPLTDSGTPDAGCLRIPGHGHPAFEAAGIEFIGSPDDRPGIRIGRPTST